MKHIILSAGHNPKARGASAGNLTEHDVAMKLIPKVVKILKDTGLTVSFVPTGSLSAKIGNANIESIANGGNALAIELHFNGSSSPSAVGNETLCCPGSVKGKKAAEAFNTKFMELAGDLVKKNRGVKEGWYKMDKPGQVDYSGDVDGDENIDAWLKDTNCTALILEPCFMSQLQEILASHEADFCEAMAQGIISAARSIE